jgi:uncharacterized protein YdiU (UPF0061 family)
MTPPDLAFEHSFAAAFEGLYVDHEPEGFSAPELLERNQPLQEQLGLPPISDEIAGRLFSGTALPPGARPIAQAYAGHHVDAEGKRFDLQLKGAGRTRFSRGGDGRATLGPVLRELLVSEALANLGISTSRVLAVVKTGEQVRRERLLPGAVLARVASSHLRVGTLEFLSIRGRQEQLAALVQYAVERHYPHQAKADNVALALLHEVAKAQAKLIASWMHVGFIHGVMNTDNVTLSGETLDYGPCAFLDVYDPATAFSSVDRHGRYAYGNQPSIGVWNMLRMTEALASLLGDDEDEAQVAADGVVDVFREEFNGAYLGGLRKKIGLEDEADDDIELMTELLDWMHATEQDFTMTFRQLARTLRGSPVEPRVAERANDDRLAAWTQRWRARLGADAGPTAADRMDDVNPIYVPRNHLVERSLEDAHRGEMATFRQLMTVLADPFVEREGLDAYAGAAPAEFGPYRTFCGT